MNKYDLCSIHIVVTQPNQTANTKNLATQPLNRKPNEWKTKNWLPRSLGKGFGDLGGHLEHWGTVHYYGLLFFENLVKFCVLCGVSSLSFGTFPKSSDHFVINTIYVCCHSDQYFPFLEINYLATA